MNNTMCYKDYIGSVEFSEPDGVYYGKVLGVRSLISYEGKTEEDLVVDFHNAVDQYLDLCHREAKEPEKVKNES